MSIIIYGVPGSPYVRMPMLACEEKGVAWELKPLRPGQSRLPAYLERHPFGKMPALEHGGFQLYEAQAILRYIDAAFDGPRLTPEDPMAMARMSQVMNILDSYVMPSLTAGIGFNRIVAPIFGIPVNEAAVAAAIPLARTSLKALEDILGDKPWFTGEALSLADLAAMAHLEMVPQSPEGAELIAGSPLLGWMARMAARPSVQTTTMSVIMARFAAAA